MKRIVALSLAILAAACAPQEPVEMSPEAQDELAERLDGLTAGPPVSCVSHRDLRGNRSYGEGVIAFQGMGNTVYVNRPTAGCPELRSGRALRTQTTIGQLCSGDIVTVFDPVTGIDHGSCSLGEFTPYRR